MKKWLVTATTIGTLVSLSVPVYASTLHADANTSLQTSTSIASTSLTAVQATPDHGFLPPA